MDEKPRRGRRRKQSPAIPSQEPPTIPSQEPLEETDDIEVVIPDPVDARAEGMAQRLLSKIGIEFKDPSAEVTPKKRTAKAKAKDEFVMSVVPMVCGLTQMACHSLVAKDYKACVPLEEELEKVFVPLARIVARYVEVTGKLSDTMLDLLAAGGATAAMSIRILATKMNIDAEKREHDDRTRGKHTGATVPHSSASINRNGTGYQRISEDQIFASSGNTFVEPSTSTSTTSASNVPSHGSFTLAEGSQADQIISRALAHDFEYRAQHGLL